MASALQKLKKKAWVVFSKWIRERDKGICFTCGKFATGRNYHAGHFVSRRHNNTLFDERNVNGQCAYCNLHLKGDAPQYGLNLQKKYNKKIVEELVGLSKQTKQFTTQELQAIIDKYGDTTKSTKRTRKTRAIS